MHSHRAVLLVVVHSITMNKQTMRRCIYVLAFTMWQRLIGWPWLRKHLYPMCCLFLAKAKESIHHAAACTAQTETNRRNGIHRMATGHFARCVSSKSSANAACEWVAQKKRKPVPLGLSSCVCSTVQLKTTHYYIAQTIGGTVHLACWDVP